MAFWGNKRKSAVFLFVFYFSIYVNLSAMAVLLIQIKFAIPKFNYVYFNIESIVLTSALSIHLMLLHFVLYCTAQDENKTSSHVGRQLLN